MALRMAFTSHVYVGVRGCLCVPGHESLGERESKGGKTHVRAPHSSWAHMMGALTHLSGARVRGT